MLHGGTSVMTQVHDYLKQYSQLDYTCSCNTSVHAFHLGVTSLVKQESGFVWVDAYILPPLISLVDHLDCDCHTKHTHAILKVDQRIWSSVIKDATSIFVANVFVQTCDDKPLLNATHLHAIVMKEFTNRSQDAVNTTTAELCAGGFAGWMHACRVCSKHGCGMRHLFSVECEQDIGDTYCKTWGTAKQVHDFQSWPEEFDASQFPLFITDLQQGWWLSCVGDCLPDIVFA